MNFDASNQYEFYNYFMEKLIHDGYIKVIDNYSCYNGTNHNLCQAIKPMYDKILPETFIIIDISNFADRITIYYDNDNKNEEIAKKTFDEHSYYFNEPKINYFDIKINIAFTIESEYEYKKNVK